MYPTYNNDFQSYLIDHCELVMYADDTALILADKNKEKLDINSFIAFNMAKILSAK